MSALFAELLREHGPFAALMPSPYEGRTVTVERRGGGRYQVRNLATLRDGAVDMLDWGIHFTRITQRCLDTETAARADNQPWIVKLAQATGMAAQQDCAAAFELAARWHKAANLPIARRDLIFRVVNAAGEFSTRTITNADELLAFAANVGEVPREYFERQRRADPVAEVDVELYEPPASSMRAVPGLVGAAPLVVQGVILLAGVVTVAWVLRSTLAWIAPAARAQAEAHEAAIDAIERTHRQNVRRCETLPPSEQAACLRDANEQLLAEIDEANRIVRRGTIVDTVIKLGAIVAIGALVLRGRRG
jgi:hypothetical protein